MASDEEVADEVDAATPKAEVEASSTLETTANGRRKSGSRKPRKKPIVSTTHMIDQQRVLTATVRRNHLA